MAKKKRRTVPKLVPEDPDSGIEDRDEALQPDLTEAERNRKVSGEARAARDRDNTYHGRKCKLAHLIDHLPQELWDAFLDDAVQPRVEAISERAVLASLLFGLLVRGLFAIHVADPLGLHDQPVYTDIPVSQAAIPDLSCRNLFLQLCRGLGQRFPVHVPNPAIAEAGANNQQAWTVVSGLARYNVAADLRVWPALVDALMKHEEVDVKRAAVTALSQLTTPSPAAQALRAWPHIRQAVLDLLWHDAVTHQLSGLLSGHSASTCLAPVCRLLLGMVKHMPPTADDVIARSRVLDLLIQAVAGPEERDGAVAALAVLHMAAMSPSLCVAVMHKYVTINVDVPEQGEMSTRTSFFAALRQRFQLSTRPSAAPHFLQPGACIAFILDATALEPWKLPGSTLAQTSYQKLMLVQLLETNMVACLISYVAVETDNLRHALASVSTQVDGLMSSILLQAEAASAVVQQQLRDLRLQLAAIKQQLDAAGTSGRMQEEWVQELLDQKDELRHEQWLLTRCLASHQQSRAVLAAHAAALVACIARMLRPPSHSDALRSSRKSSLPLTLATSPREGKASHSMPQLVNLRRAIELLTWLLTSPPTPPNSAAAPDDGGLLLLRARLHAQMLSAGLVPAGLRCAHNSKACESFMLEAATMLRNMEVPDQVVRLMQRMLGVLRADMAALHAMDVRLRVRAKAVQEEAKRVRKALMLNIPKDLGQQRHRMAELNALSAYVADDDIRQRAIQLKQEAAELSKSRGSVTELSLRLTLLGSEADLQLQALTSAHAQCQASLTSPLTTADEFAADATSPPQSPVRKGSRQGVDGDIMGDAAGAVGRGERAGGAGEGDGCKEQLQGSELCGSLPVPLLLPPGPLVVEVGEEGIVPWISQQHQHYQQQPGPCLVTKLGACLKSLAQPSNPNIELLRELGVEPPTSSSASSPSPSPLSRLLRRVVGRPRSSSTSVGVKWAVENLTGGGNVLGTRPFSASVAAKSVATGSVAGESLITSSGAGSVAASAWWGFEARSQAASSHTQSTPRSEGSRSTFVQRLDTSYGGVGGGLNTITLLDEASTLLRLLSTSILLMPGPPPGPMSYAAAPETPSNTYPVLPPSPSLPLSPSLPPTPFQLRSLPSLPPTPGQAPCPASFDPLAVEGEEANPPQVTLSRQDAGAPHAGTEPDAAPQATNPLIQLVSRQAEELAQALAHITLLGVTSRGLARSAALLLASGPAYSSLSAAQREQWAAQDPEVKLGFASLPPARLLSHLPDLMRCWTGCMQAGEPGDVELLAGAVAEIAELGYTKQADSYAKVYVQSGMLPALLHLLAAGRLPQPSHKAQWSTDRGPATPPRKSSTARGRFGKKALGKDRAAVSPGVSRPSEAGLAAQKEAARALVSIGRYHPEALAAVASDKSLLATVVSLTNDLNIGRPARHQAARLLSALLLVGQPPDLQPYEPRPDPSPAWVSVVEAALAAGAFNDLLQLLESDHRSVSAGAKPVIMRALSYVVTQPPLRKAVAKLHADQVESHLRRLDKTVALHNHAAALAGVEHGIVDMQTEQGVAQALARALWSVPRQLHQVMTSDSTSKGRLVEPAILAAMADLGCLAARELEVLAEADREARAAVQSLGLAVRINQELVNAVRDPGLGAALMQLKATLP
ncbi:hypothetical protein QJQ45_018489 [Haematococcus lacustris]|nr:hypothetical protein QJQ45_018489 [Haematococcus lacustris]